MSDDLKERPPVLKRRPRPAADEKVDPVDYSPAAPAQASDATLAPVVAQAAEPDASRVAPVVKSEPDTTAPATQPVTVETPVAPPAATQAVKQAAPVRQQARASTSTKKAVNTKTSRREVTYPFSTRLAQNVVDVLYAAADEEGISVREATEQAILSRWG
ncbi:hypothetical protein [Arthrobacter sp. efr-133-R2A-63]|uniref:hypothetical protein n=1 Tax=Arthrobacter sp. efr-133-R2A-63 TaxID=3040278 RepID=UPI00254AD3F8|nr:hypothetical protein [Arthrobacter sp. efr-133-R2A-63]